MNTTPSPVDASHAPAPATSVSLLHEVALLAQRAHAAAAAKALATRLGARELILFMRDAETRALLPAPGFPQTLPDGRRWQAFLNECVARGTHTGRLPYIAGDDPVLVSAHASGEDTVLALIGLHDMEPRADIGAVLALVPLLTAAYRGEQATVFAASQVRLAEESARRASALATTLDVARRQLESALATARDARAELEAANKALESRGHELRVLNDQLSEQAWLAESQAAELEAQSDELHTQNRDLEAARSAADSANRAKSEFLATMSHELRTPLNAIGGHTEILALGIHGPVNDAQRESLDRIARSSRHLLGLINDVLNLARIESGRIEYKTEAVPLSLVLDDVAPMIETQLQAQHIRYEIHGKSELPTVRADREKLQQILLNVLSNAIKFTQAGGAITVSAEQTAEDKAVSLHIADTGMGIPGEKLASIFEPFVQVDGSRTRKDQGTGLGLAISRDLARGMSGDLSAQSTMGKGSTFTLTLPPAML